AAVVGGDAGQFAGGQADVDLRVGTVEYRPRFVQHRKAVALTVQMAGDLVITAVGQAFIGDQGVPVHGGQQPVELVFPQQIDPRRNDQQRQGEQQIVFDQQRKQAAFS